MYQYKFGFGSRELELKSAIQFFRRSISCDPDLGEAHLRLGRVMGLIGNPDEAATELQKSAGMITDPKLQYYLSLFLGQELSTRGHTTETRQEFEHAAKLFPNAQSPLLALSRLAQTQAAILRVRCSQFNSSSPCLPLIH